MRFMLRSSAWLLVAILLLPIGCKRMPVPGPLLSASRAMATAAPQSGADRHIAFSHMFVLEISAGAVETTQQKNLSACLAAGCTVLATHIDRMRNGLIQGSISVRIAPDRYAAFATAVTAPPATLISHTETAEDKTVPFLDIEKRLEAQTALRDRLSAMLKQAGTNVSDLVTVEKQLADVQGTIESQTAQRDYLRTITGTVKVDVTYNGLIEQAGPLDISPIRIAFDNFFNTLIQSLGTLIDFVATALPWVPLTALAGWVLRLLLRRWVLRRWVRP